MYSSESEKSKKNKIWMCPKSVCFLFLLIKIVVTVKIDHCFDDDDDVVVASVGLLI